MPLAKKATILYALATSFQESWSTPPPHDEDIIECPPTLHCSENALCVQGGADFSNHPHQGEEPLKIHEETTRDGAHCQCPPGWTGLECDRKFKTCGSGHKCYHGGQCVEGLIDNFGNSQLFCDCHDAFDENGTRYVGKWCEHASVDLCDREDDVLAEEAFCVNEGSCNDYYPVTGPPCLCNGNFEGPHCEFKTGTVPPCTLTCQNGGHCNLFGIRNPDQDSVIFSSNITDYMYCSCPPGFGGRNCEVSKANFAVTVMCTNKEPSFSQPQSFCVNGGKCAKDILAGDPHPGCICTDEFVGAHCETIVKESEPKEVPTEAPPSANIENGEEFISDKYSKKGLISTFLVSIGVTITLIAFVLLHRIKKSEQTNQQTKQEQPSPFMVNLAPVSDPLDELTTSPYLGTSDKEISRLQYRDPQQHDVRPPESMFLDIGPPRDEDGHSLHDLTFA